MNMLKVNGVVIPTPSTYEYQLYDLDGEEGSGRNQQGLMFRDRKAVKRKVACTWNGINATTASTLLKAVKDEFFTLTYYDVLENKYTTMTAYVGDRTMPFWIYDKASKQFIVKSLSMNFIER